jgi:sn-glycerol 3-phosphate transport system permease protein
MVDREPLLGTILETVAAWVLGVLWLLPLLFAIWTAIHPSAYVAEFDLLAPVTTT